MNLTHLFFLLVLTLTCVQAHPYQVFRENGKVGLKNDQGKVVIPARYESIGWSNGNFSIINDVTGCKTENHWGLINLNNQKVTAVEYEELYPAGGDIMIARKRTPNTALVRTGAITISGKEVIPFLYDGITIDSFRAIVFTKIGNQYRYGLIDLSNKTIIPQQYQDIKSIGTLRYAVRNFEGKMAVFTEGGKQMSSFSIDSISPFQSGYAVVFEGKYRGLIDRNGVVRLPAKFREINIENERSIKAREPDRWTVLTGDNKHVKDVGADSLDVIDQVRYKVNIAGQVQLTDDTFVPVVQGVFSDIGPFVNGRARYTIRRLSGVIQADGTVIVPALYRDVHVGSNFILANSGYGERNAWILFDSAGARKTTRVYDEMASFSPGLFVVRAKGYYGLVDLTGKEVARPIYDSIIARKDNYVTVKFQGLYGIIDLEERWIVTPRAHQVQLLSADRYLEFTATNTNLRARNGSLIYFTTNKLEAKDDHLIEHVSSGNLWKIDFDGVIVDRQVLPDQSVEVIYPETEGLRAVKRNGRYGFVDSKGRLRIANRYEAVRPFSEGLAPVQILGKWGFINMQDNVAIQPVYERVWDFQNGRALVTQKGLYGLVDTNGKLVLPVRHESIEILSTGNMLIRLNGLVGLTDPSGKVLVTPRYSALTDTGSGYVIVSKDGKFGVVTTQGVSTIPIVYDLIRYDPYHNQFLALKKSAWTQLTP